MRSIWSKFAMCHITFSSHCNWLPLVERAHRENKFDRSSPQNWLVMSDQWIDWNCTFPLLMLPTQNLGSTHDHQQGLGRDGTWTVQRTVIVCVLDCNPVIGVQLHPSYIGDETPYRLYEPCATLLRHFCDNLGQFALKDDKGRQKGDALRPFAMSYTVLQYSTVLPFTFVTFSNLFWCF